MYYIQETDKPHFFERHLNYIRLENDKIILPISKEEKKTFRKAEKLAKKTKQILSKTHCKKVCLSKEIKRQEDYINQLLMDQVEVINGKWLFGILIKEVLEYIIRKRNWKKEETKLSILINEISNPIFENIRELISQYKSVNIITNHIDKFKKIEEEILRKEGIVITVGNNKKKGLKHADLILNVDFPSELVNQYQLPEEGVIINLLGNVKIHKKRFNGLNINDYEIEFENHEEFDHDKQLLYDQKDIYEAQIYQNQPLEYIQRKLNRDHVKIKKLIGNRSYL